MKSPKTSSWSNGDHLGREKESNIGGRKRSHEQLGFGADMRDYSLLGPMLRHLDIKSVRLMTNNPRKVAAMEELGVTVVERISRETGSNPHNEKYLETKAGKLGHMFGVD